MDSPTPRPADPATQRRWPRFSLRAMLIGVAFCGIWLSVVCNRANRQRRAVETITRAGGIVWYDYQTDDSGSGSEATGPAVRLDAPPPGPAWLRNLIGIDYFANVVGASMYGGSAYDEPGATDNGSVTLGELPRLKAVELFRKCITDDTMAHLRGSAELRHLLVTDSSVSDAGWRSLEYLPRLKGLVLGGSNVDDITLSHVQDLTALKYLALGQTRVADVGLHYLGGLSQLTLLEVSLNDKITATGVRELKRARPRLTVVGP